MRSKASDWLSGQLLDDEMQLGLQELCRYCGLNADDVEALVVEGVVEPMAGAGGSWHFQAISVARIRRASALHRDLGVNWAGAALALELLDEVEQLRARLRDLD